MSKQVTDEALNVIYRDARTHNYWQAKPVDDAVLKAAYDLAKMGPTSANMCPLRIAFVKTPEAKAKLVECVSEGNKAKVAAAPVTAVIVYDIDFHEELPWLFPHTDAKSCFEGNEQGREEGAFRNSSLQGGYLILAARALGLDVGPMSGFDNAKVDAAFFAGTAIKSNFICNLGHGDPAKVRPRAPRLSFEEACRIV